MNFQDIMSITNVLLTLIWMLVAYVIFKLQANTFQVQADTFREQRNVTNLSYKKFIYDIKPVVTGQFNKTDDYRFTGRLKVQLNVVFKEPNIVRNIRIFKISTLPEGGTVTGPIDTFPFNSPLSIFELETSKKFPVNTPVGFIFEYEDEVGTIYNQKVWGDLDRLFLDPAISINKISSY
jgi:hypothetical protein